MQFSFHIINSCGDIFNLIPGKRHEQQGEETEIADRGILRRKSAGLQIPAVWFEFLSNCCPFVSACSDGYPLRAYVYLKEKQPAPSCRFCQNSRQRAGQRELLWV